MTKQSLTYFEDADKSEMPILLKDKEVSWDKMKATIVAAAKDLL